MPQRTLMMFLTVWAIGLLGFGIVNLTRARQVYHNDYYWTPTTQHESLAERQGHFEFFVRGKLLQRRLRDGELGFRSGDSWSPLQEADVTIRRNHAGEATRI